MAPGGTSPRRADVDHRPRQSPGGERQARSGGQQFSVGGDDRAAVLVGEDLAAEPPEKTEADFLDLVKKYPNFPNVHFYYGTYLAAHHPEECLDEFLKELRISPRSVPTRVELARRYIIERKFDEALKYAREAVALSPESVNPQLALGQVYQAQGKDELALVPFSEAKRIDPVSPNVRMYLVNAYRALGRIEEMRRELAEYKRLKADQPNWP